MTAREASARAPRLSVGAGLVGGALLGLLVWLFARHPSGVVAPALSKPVPGESPASASLAELTERSSPHTGPEAADATDRYADFLVAITREFPFGRERQSVLREMLEGAPSEAVEALLRLTFPDPERNDLSHVLLDRLAGLAPDEALAFAREQGFGAEPPWWHSVIGGLADPLAAAADIRALPASDARKNFLGHIAMQAALASPAAAFGFADSLPAAGAERSLALANVIVGASRRDPAVALGLAELHPEADGGPALTRGLVVDWAMNDYAAADDHVRALPTGAMRDVAVAGLAAVAIDRDFANASALIAEVRDADARRALHLQLAKTWLLREPVAASEWIGRTQELGATEKAEARAFAARVAATVTSGAFR